MEKFNDIIEKVEKLTVVELAELVKALEEKFGVSAAMPATSGNGAGVAAAAEEKSTYDVILKAVGDQKVNVIKAIKEITGLGLQESKALVDGAPKTVKSGLKKEEAEEVRQKLAAVGAVVELA